MGCEEEESNPIRTPKQAMMSSTHVDAEQSGHPVQIVGVVGHAQDFGYDGVLRPLGSKPLHQLHQVAGGRLADGVHWRATAGTFCVNRHILRLPTATR